MKYDLVFEGGGAKGMVFVGAMQEFEEQGHTYERLLGTSAGAITATFLAAEYTTQEMLDALSEQEEGQPVFASFMGPPAAFDDEAVRNSATLALLRNLDFSFIPNFLEKGMDEKLTQALMKHFPNVFSLIERGGWYSADKFLAWMRRKLDEGAFQGNPRHFSQMTMGEYYQATGRDLSLVTSDTSGARMLVLNHKTAPDLPVVWAVRMSMSIPMVWPEVEWQAEWGAYRGQDITGHRLVDGGLLSNFPIELFLSNEAHITAVMGQEQGDDVLGLLIDESQPVPGTSFQAASLEEAAFDLRQTQFVQRLNRLVNTATTAHDKMVIETFENKVVRLPAHGYGTTEFDMPDARREALVAAGREAMAQFFQRQALASVSFGDVEEPMMDVTSYADKLASKMLGE